MKTKSNQAFTTFDFIVTSVSVAIIVLVSGPIISKNLQSGNIEKAQKETHDLAFELLNSADNSALRLASHPISLGSSARGIASVDEQSAWIGSSKKDPWGNPYHFRFLRNAQGMPVELVVWSEGPDKKSLPDVRSQDGVEKADFASDDVAASFPLR